MKAISTAFSRYGSVVKIHCKGNTITTKGFIKPVYRKHSGFLNLSLTIMGEIDNSHYVLLVPPVKELGNIAGCTVECKDREYVVKNSGKYTVADKDIYVWAVLTACTELKGDDYDNGK